jgi:uncharacterized membrane protein
MATLAEAVTAKRARIESVDLLRGVVMIIMALDHTRDYFGVPGSPTNLATASVALFFTRWTTNICAPVFFLLTGTGARLSLGKRSKPDLSRFLFTRGLWLIFLDLVLFRCLIVQFNFDYHVTIITVLWALGWSMIVLSLLIWLPTAVIPAFGVLMIVTHNLFDSVQSANPIWTILHSPNFLIRTPTHTVFLAYPLIPWIGVTAAGKVPMFYYLLHFFLIHLLAVVICYVRFGEIHSMFQSPDLGLYPITQPPGWGLSLPLVYLIWIAVVIAVYPLCRWYAGLRRRSNNPWLSYL